MPADDANFELIASVDVIEPPAEAEPPCANVPMGLQQSASPGERRYRSE